MRTLRSFCAASIALAMASAVSAEEAQVPLKAIKPLELGDKVVATPVEDSLTGCRYWVSTLPAYIGPMGVNVSRQGIPTIRYRADGKPDCRDVK